MIKTCVFHYARVLFSLGFVFLITASQTVDAQTPSPVFSQIKKLSNSSGQAKDKFGNAVALSGDLLAVGVKTADSSSGSNRGAVFVYERNLGGADNWGLVKKLSATDGSASDGFGVSVAISGNTIVIGADGDNIGSNTNQGSAYVFEKDAGGPDNWGQVKKLIASDGARNDHFGISVSINDDTIVIGVDRADVNEKADQGAAYVFNRHEGGAENWGESQKLTAFDGAASDNFGVSVAISENTIIVGADHADVGRLSNIGAAYIFTRPQSSDSFSFFKKLVPGDGASSDNFGGSVAVSKNTIVVGACCHNVGRSSNQGTAYVFERNLYGPNTWTQSNVLLGPSSEASAQFGFSVSIDSDLIAIGSKLDDVEGNKDQGLALLFGRHEAGPGRWGLIKELIAVDGTDEDQFGTTVAVSGKAVVVGSPNNDVLENPDQGAAYIFTAFSSPILPQIISNGFAGADYFQPLSVNGGVAPFNFAVTDGVLPSGVVLNGVSGIISGVTDKVGKAVFTITATDAQGAHALSTYAVTTACPQIKLSPNELPKARVVIPYKQAVIAESWPANTAPYTFKVISGGLPQGLSLDSATGIISGRPYFVGVYHFTIAVTDAYGCTNSRAYSLRIAF